MHALSRFVAGVGLIAATVGAGALGASAIAAGSAGAATLITVNDAGDAVVPAANCTAAPEQDCTLRAALAEATALATNVAVEVPDPTTLATPESQYFVDTNHGALDVSDSGHSVTIQGAGQSLAVIAAGCATEDCSVSTRVMTIAQGTTAEISGVTVEKGDQVGTQQSGGSVDGNGGGILDNGDLTLRNSTVTGNQATASGGGLELDQGASATLTNDTISDNVVNGAASGLGGGIAVINPSAGAAESLALDSTTVSGNTIGGGNQLAADGAGIAVENSSGEGPDPNLHVDIDRSTISGNHILLVQNAEGDGIMATDGTWEVTNSPISGNGRLKTAVSGGGVFISNPPLSATFTNDSITQNDAFVGGGIDLQGGALTLTNDTISGNEADNGGGGFYDNSGLASAVTISSTTIDHNLVGTDGQGVGGGIESVGCNDIDLTNDTITDNFAPSFGGGYFGQLCSVDQQPRELPHAQGAPDSSANASFTFDTVAGNTSQETEGQAFVTNDSSELTLGDSIVAPALDGPNCEFFGDGTVTSDGYNLSDGTGCGAPASTDVIGPEPQLGALGANGGPTQTELPAPTSLAVGTIPAAACAATGVTTDQRGEARGEGTNGSCTIGAVEVAAPASTPPPPVTSPASDFNPNGYRLVANEGGIFDFGLDFNGSLADTTLNAPIVGLANSPGPDGYLMVGSDGGVFAEGGANFYGSLGGQTLASPIAAIAAPPSETGYWLVSQSGTISNFGSVPALAALHLPAGARVVGMASTADGTGAWLTDQLGDVYALGSAQYEGGMGGKHLNAPVVGIAAAASGQGYVLVASDGGVYTYGSQGFSGSVPGSLSPGQTLAAPIVGIAVTNSGNGYWEVGSDGGVFNYGDAPFLGSVYTAIPGQKLNGPIVGIQHLGEQENAALTH